MVIVLVVVVIFCGGGDNGDRYGGAGGGHRFDDGGGGGSGGDVLARMSGSNIRRNSDCSELILFHVFLNHPSTARNSKFK